MSSLKYRAMIPMGKPLADALVQGVRTMDPFPDTDLLVPVPLSRRGLWGRGFNQSNILAGPLARHRDLVVEPGALKKRGNRAQVGLTAGQRERNAAASFAPGRTIHRVKGRHVLLFDDVYTTGATVRTCARILKRAGAEVSVLTLARARARRGG